MEPDRTNVAPTTRSSTATSPSPATLLQLTAVSFGLLFFAQYTTVQYIIGFLIGLLFGAVLVIGGIVAGLTWAEKKVAAAKDQELRSKSQNVLPETVCHWFSYFFSQITRHLIEKKWFEKFDFRLVGFLWVYTSQNTNFLLYRYLFSLENLIFLGVSTSHRRLCVVLWKQVANVHAVSFQRFLSVFGHERHTSFFQNFRARPFHCLPSPSSVLAKQPEHRRLPRLLPVDSW